MKLLRKIKNFFKRYLLDITFRNKIHLIPEISLVVYGLISTNYSLIFYGCLVIALLNIILNAIGKKIAINQLKKQVEVVSNQIEINDKSDDDIKNL